MRRRIALFSVVATILVALVLSFVYRPATVQADMAYELNPPPFMQTTAPDSNLDMSAVANEAGIAAYFKANQAINLATVAGLYRTIETQNANYVIGSAPITDYPESYDVHVYVHRDGWFMAYYLAADPAAKMLDLDAYTGSNISTLFEKVLTIFASEAGVTYPGVSFYDFRFPNANRLMAIVEDSLSGGNDFTVFLPSSFVYFERSWSLFGCYPAWKLNDISLTPDRQEGNCNSFQWGKLGAAQLTPDTTFTVSVTGQGDAGDVGSLVLVYRVP